MDGRGGAIVSSSSHVDGGQNCRCARELSSWFRTAHRGRSRHACSSPLARVGAGRGDLSHTDARASRRREDDPRAGVCPLFGAARTSSQAGRRATVLTGCLDLGVDPEVRSARRSRPTQRIRDRRPAPRLNGAANHVGRERVGGVPPRTCPSTAGPQRIDGCAWPPPSVASSKPRRA